MDEAIAAAGAAEQGGVEASAVVVDSAVLAEVVQAVEGQAEAGKR